MFANPFLLRRLFAAVSLRPHRLSQVNCRRIPRFSSTMPPAPSRTSSKRKLESEEEEVSESDREESSQKPKKARKAKKESLISNQPRNKVMPENIDIPPKHEGSIRIVAYNICGFAASSKKGLPRYIKAEDADVLIITETKLQQPPADPALTERYPHQYWSAAAKKGYSGTAILSKIKPLSVDYTLPGHPNPESIKGRIVTLEFDTCYVVGTYVVNAGAALKTMPEKQLWQTHFYAYMRELDKKKPIIWAGDFNVAPTELDITNHSTNWNKSAGYTEIETSAYKNFLNDPENPEANKFSDLWRDLHGDLRAYSYFSYRFNCREKGIGWRLDGVVASERLKERVKMCEIRDEIYGASDHCPMVVEIEGPL